MGMQSTMKTGPSGRAVCAQRSTNKPVAARCCPVVSYLGRYHQLHAQASNDRSLSLYILAASRLMGRGSVCLGWQGQQYVGNKRA